MMRGIVGDFLWALAAGVLGIAIVAALMAAFAFIATGAVRP